jgi:hypothetical protein
MTQFKEIRVPRQCKEVFVLLQELRNLTEKDPESLTLPASVVGEWFEKTNDKVCALFGGDWENAPEAINFAMAELEPDFDDSLFVLRNHNTIPLERHPHIVSREAFHDRLADRQEEKPPKIPYVGEMDKQHIVECLDVVREGLLEILIVKNASSSRGEVLSLTARHQQKNQRK